MDLTIDNLKKMMKEMELSGFKPINYPKKTIECPHDFRKGIKEEFPHTVTIHCPDCGSPFWFAGEDLIKAINRLLLQDTDRLNGDNLEEL